MALQALWLALALMDTGALRPYCPMHDGPAPAMHSQAMGHMAPDHAPRSSGTSRMAAAGHSGSPEPQPGHVAGCPCLGDCASLAPIAVPTSGPREWALAGATSHAAALPAEIVSPHHLPSDHFLPFPHAPPLA